MPTHPTPAVYRGTDAEMRPGIDIGIARESAARRERYGRYAYRAPGSSTVDHIDLTPPDIQVRIDKRKEEIIAAHVEAEAQRLARIEVAYRIDAALNKRMAINDVLAIAEAVVNLPLAVLKGPTRSRPHAWPRHFAIWLLREIRWDLSLSQIGAAFGGRDHTTILHALANVEKQLIVSPFRTWIADPRTQALLQTRGAK